MSERVYILFRNSGDYEDHQRVVCGAFASLDEAVSVLLTKASEVDDEHKYDFPEPVIPFEYKEYSIIERVVGDFWTEDEWIYLLITESRDSGEFYGYTLVRVRNKLRIPVCDAVNWGKFTSEYAGQIRCKLCEEHDTEFDDQELPSLTEFNKKWFDPDK